MGKIQIDHLPEWQKSIIVFLALIGGLALIIIVGQIVYENFTVFAIIGVSLYVFGVLFILIRNRIKKSRHDIESENIKEDEDVPTLRTISLNDLFIKQTKNTPFVLFGKYGKFQISGRSIPEDGCLFFEPIFDWVADYLKNPNSFVVLTIDIEYMNDIISKFLLRIIKDLHQNCNYFKVKWVSEKGDADMYELGQIIHESSECNIEFIEK